MKMGLTLSTVALMVLSTSAFAGAHIDGNGLENAGDALNNAGNAQATASIVGSPSNGKENGRGATAATVKGGNAKSDD